jgi:hypothetical protein
VDSASIRGMSGRDDHRWTGSRSIGDVGPTSVV